MKLLEVLNGVDFTSNKSMETLKEIIVQDITYNSSKANINNLFVALKGQTVDGHKYVQDAYSRGCRTFLLEEDLALSEDANKIVVKDTRKSLSRISSNFFGNPSSKLKIIGVTGTKGKTTVTNYINGVLNSSGINTGVIGTNGAFYNGKNEKTINTTPESYELHRIFANMLADGVECVAMEVSSGGLMMDRVSDVDFDIALFTNISPDHIGPKEHPTFEHYLECKAKLFSLAKLGLVNADDKYANYIIKKSECPIRTYSINRESDLQASNLQHSNSLDSLGMEFICKELENEFKCYIPSPGEFSVYNALSVVSVCKQLGISNELIISALRDVKVDGRVQVLPVLPYATVIVDYAHNGVSLESILKTIKVYNPSRVLCVFGSVGGRTKGRRKELGDVAAKLCDVCILTSDNPDYEDPIEIIKDIEKSFVDSDCQYYIEPDRKRAIEFAIRYAEEGDVILFAGKGHERYQLINGEQLPFYEPEIAMAAAKQLLLEKDRIDMDSTKKISVEIDESVIISERSLIKQQDIQRMITNLGNRTVAYCITKTMSERTLTRQKNNRKYNIITLDYLSQNHKEIIEPSIKQTESFIKDDLVLLNMDDKNSTSLLNVTKAKMITFGIENQAADILCKDLDISNKRAKFNVVIAKELNLQGNKYIPGEFSVELPISGIHTVYNALIVIIIALANGVKVTTIQEAVREIKDIAKIL